MVKLLLKMVIDYFLEKEGYMAMSRVSWGVGGGFFFQKCGSFWGMLHECQVPLTWTHHCTLGYSFKEGSKSTIYNLYSSIDLSEF